MVRETIMIFSLTVTLSSVGSSGLPGAGLISVLPLISPIKVTNADVAMLIVTDWLVLVTLSSDISTTDRTTVLFLDLSLSPYA